jgi:hypothetical protein
MFSTNPSYSINFFNQRLMIQQLNIFGLGQADQTFASVNQITATKFFNHNYLVGQQNLSRE